MSSSQGDIEQKYIFIAQQHDGMLSWLNHCLIPDTSFPVGRVSSIYYDTPNLDLYDEKRNSDYVKSKVRLRWYSDLAKGIINDDITCYLEVKEKWGVFRKKNRIEIPLSSWMLKGDVFTEEKIETIPSRVHELSSIPSGFLVPTILIQYMRYRFLDPQTGSRVALDTDIECTHVNSRYVEGFPPVHLDQGVLEVKGSRRDLPNSLNGIRSYLSREAFSKYARCLEHLMLPLSRRI